MPSTRSLRERKKQTRIAFTPLASSSPVREQYSKAIHDRLANVRFEGSHSAQKQRDSVHDRTNSGLPTPEPSSQPTAYLEDHTHLSRSKPLLKEVPDAPSSTRSALPDSPDPLSTRETTPPQLQSETDEDDLPVPSSKRRKVNRVKAGHHTTSSRRSTRLLPQLRRRTPSSGTSSGGQGQSVTEISSPLKRLSDLADAETTGDEDDVMPAAPGTRRRRVFPQDDFVVNDTRIDYISSDDEPDRTRTPKKRKSLVDDFVAADNEVEFITSDEGKMAADTSKRPKSKNRKDRTQEEQEELDDDLADLQDDENSLHEDSDHGNTSRRRTRGGPVTTQKDKARAHFEQLRRRRAGEAISRVEDTEDADDSVEEVDIDQIEQAIRNAGDDEGFSHSSSDGDPQVEEVIQDEDDFIVEDTTQDTPRRGRPDSGIPLQFTSFASAKPKELFIHVIEWLVKNKIAPAFARSDELYNLSWSRIDDQVKAQAGSRLISSAWNATFKHSIIARPRASISYLDDFDALDPRTCDACNRTNHPARYDFILSGEAYSYKTLEPIDAESDSEKEDGDDSDADNISRDEAGHPLAPQSTHFYLGRFCAANAEMGHKLTHWKYHLNQNLMDYLEEQGVLSAEAIVSRERLNKKKREREAEAIVDRMVESGVVEELWAGFQGDLEDARMGMEDFEGHRGGGRGKGRVGSVKAKGGVWDGGKFRREVRVESDSEGE